VIYDWRNRMATHQPVLYAAVSATAGAIAEFGCGYVSTPMLHALATNQHRRLVTLESDAGWLERFRALESPLHELRLVADWETELARPEWDDEWSVVFVDNDPFPARAATVRRLRDRAELVVLHDCDYFPREGLFGKELAPLLGPRARGERDFGDMFASWRELFPPEPWPFAPTGPPTLLASNRRDVDAIPVDFERMLPLWWRVVRPLRNAVPQSLRRRVASLIRWGYSMPQR
jgi:hypothetical protein